jgi:hypothetical protein
MLLTPNSIRLYSTRTVKSLGTLQYHKAACQAVAFAHLPIPVPFDQQDLTGTSGEEEEEDFTSRDREDRTRWLFGGGKDNRVSVWALMDFNKPSKATAA